MDTRTRASWGDREGTVVRVDDTIEFGADITRANVVFTKDALDLVISIRDRTDTLRVSNQFRGSDDGVEHFRFHDDTTTHPDALTISDVEQLLQIEGGNRGDNVIVGQLDAPNTLDGRQGDDTLIGGYRADTYAFTAGYGFDTIIDQADQAGVIDRVVFGASVRREDLIFTRSGNDLRIDLGNHVDVLTITGGLGNRQVEQFLFADGTTLLLDDVKSLLLVGTTGDDNILGFDGRDDVLSGGKGSDALNGGTGNDTYRFGYGNGQDTIADSGGTDQLEFGPKVAKDGVTFARIGDDLIVTLTGTTDRIAVLGGAAGSVIDSFVFDDGETLGLCRRRRAAARQRPQGADRNAMIWASMPQAHRSSRGRATTASGWLRAAIWCSARATGRTASRQVGGLRAARSPLPIIARPTRSCASRAAVPT